MELTNRQKDILLGTLLGDGYLQKTGAHNARLRIEHSLKQKAYVDWKYEELENIFRSEPVFLRRVHPSSHQMYSYIRLQSYADSLLGKLKLRFYKNGRKTIPLDIKNIIANPLSLAVWYMDDGYYDKRDKSAHIYLQAFDAREIQLIISGFSQLGIECKAYCRPDRKACQLNFRNIHKNKLLSMIEPHLIAEMRYKLPLDPVTTDSQIGV